LHAETKVLSTRTANVGSGTPVKNHEDLKAHFEKARRLGVPLCITFTNDHVTAAIIEEKSRFYWREWSKDDEHLWIGRCATGFDGGAYLLHRSQAALNDATNGAWHFVNIGEEAERENTTSYSINEQSGGKRIRFAESNEYRTYLIDSLPTEFLLNPDGTHVQVRKQKVPVVEETVSLPSHTGVQEEQAMPLGGTLQAFLLWLENGGLKHVDSPDEMEQIRKSVKQELNSVSTKLAKRPNDQNLGRRKASLELRDKLLKIHANALHLIQLSKSLKDWARFQISIGKIDGIKVQGIQPARMRSGSNQDVRIDGTSFGSRSSSGGRENRECTGFLRMRGLPFKAGKEDIVKFFLGYDPVLDSIVLTQKDDGRATGDAYVGFASPEDARRAMVLHGSIMGSRFIELFICTKDDPVPIVAHSDIVGDVFIIYENGRAPEASKSLPRKQMSLQGEIVYDDTALPPTYQLNYNSVMTKSRAVEIRLSVIGHDGKPDRLGKIGIPLSKMHQFCKNDEWKDLAFHAESNHRLANGRVCLRGRRVALDPPDYVEKKQEEALRRMKTAIEWIKRFNGEIVAHNRTYNDNLKSVGADVKIGNTNITLLHAGKHKGLYLPPSFYPSCHRNQNRSLLTNFTNLFHCSYLLERRMAGRGIACTWSESSCWFRSCTGRQHGRSHWVEWYHERAFLWCGQHGGGSGPQGIFQDISR